MPKLIKRCSHENKPKLGFLLFTFGSAVSVLDHDQAEFQDVLSSAVALFAITVKLYQDDYRGQPAVEDMLLCFRASLPCWSDPG